jgi:hypothetical protein
LVAFTGIKMYDMRGEERHTQRGKGGLVDGDSSISSAAEILVEARRSPFPGCMD